MHSKSYWEHSSQKKKKIGNTVRWLELFHQMPKNHPSWVFLDCNRCTWQPVSPFLFSDISLHCISSIYLPFFLLDIQTINDAAWGPAAVAYLLSSVVKPTSKENSISLKGLSSPLKVFLFYLQVFVYPLFMS